MRDKITNFKMKENASSELHGPLLLSQKLAAVRYSEY